MHAKVGSKLPFLEVRQQERHVLVIISFFDASLELCLVFYYVHQNIDAVSYEVLDEDAENTPTMYTRIWETATHSQAREKILPR